MVTSLVSLYFILAVAQAGGPAQTTAGSQAAGSTVKPLTLTLSEVVNTAVNNNTNVVLAKQRLAEAVEGIKQVNALGRPQLNSVVADTYSTFAESEGSYSAVVTNPTLPGGSVIPTVVDQAADFPTSFGLGTLSGSSGASGAGTLSSFTGTSITLPAVGASTITGSSATTALPGLNTPTTGSGTTSTTGTSTTGTTVSPSTTTTPSDSGTVPSDSSGAGSSSSSAPSASGVSFELTPMPAIIQNYVTEAGAPQIVVDEVSNDADDSETGSEKADSMSRSAGDSTNQADEPAKMPDQQTNAGTGTTTTNSGAVAIGKTAVNNYGARVNLSQFVDVFGLLSAETSAEKLTTDFYATDIERTENEVALSAKNLYFNVVLAQENVATDQESVNDATESVRVTNALVQNGQAAGFDLLSAETTLANDQQLLTAAQDNYSFAVSDLDYLLGLNPNTPLVLTVPPLPPLTQAVDLSQSTQVALQRRPELSEANQNIKLARKLVKVASAGTTPTVGIVGTYGYNSENTVSGPTNEGLFSAQVAIPFDDGGATRSRVREAKVALQSQITTKNELMLNVQLEVRQAYLNILEGQSSVSTAQSGVNLATETLRVANVQYQNGLGTILDVENAQAQLATARTNLANAQFTYETALASLVRAIGSR